MRVGIFLIIYFTSVGFLFAQYSNSPIPISRSADFEYLSAPDTNGFRNLLKVPVDEREQTLKLPYPIIFVHGLNSNSATWDSTTHWLDSLFDFGFGGRFDFCLNYDADYTLANKHFNTPDADMALFTSNIIPGDYYYVNFDVGTNGSVSPGYWDTSNVVSNQSAIAKQGYAVKWAIERVLQETGKEKVILFGHSMGGLASREYLQNPENWQQDGQTHVAKLVTTGTPHGGSNSTAYGLGIFIGLDEESEAVRDLRRTYYYSLDSGVFLYGGLELQNDSTNMNDNWGTDFYNVDVNCNGISGETVIGLNHKPLSDNIDYSCIIGVCDGCLAEDDTIGDGIVNEYCANLSNFYPDAAIHKFYYNAPAYSEIHTVLPSLNYENMLGLDEPQSFPLSYQVNFDTHYLGFSTIQAEPPYFYDYDTYNFTMPYTGAVSIDIANLYLSQLVLCVFDSVYNSVGIVNQSMDTLGISYTQYLAAGKYYIRISAMANQASYLYPYDFVLKATPGTPTSVSENGSNEAFMIHPNPVTNQLNINISDRSKNYTVELFNSIGQKVYATMIATGKKAVVDMAELPSGVYTLRLDSETKHITKKIIKK